MSDDLRVGSVWKGPSLTQRFLLGPSISRGKPLPDLAIIGFVGWALVFAGSAAIAINKKISFIRVQVPDSASVLIRLTFGIGCFAVPFVFSRSERMWRDVDKWQRAGSATENRGEACKRIMEAYYQGSDFGDVKKTKSLDLSNLGLSSLPLGIWNLTGLESLNLSGNALETISPKIQELEKLKTLILAGNQLKSWRDIVKSCG
jgi:Leucine-rich repeat (LRR) protein